MMDDIAPSAGQFGESVKLIFRWKRSIYKLIWEPFLIYVAMHVMISLSYDFLMSETLRREFEELAAYCFQYTSSMPVILLLGFFTSTSMHRWFSIVNAMPGTAKVITNFILSLKEDIPQGEEIISQYSRWIILSWTLTFRSVCQPLRRLYPDLLSLQRSGLVLQHERVHLEREAKRCNLSESQLALIVLDWNLELIARCNRMSHFSIPMDCNRQVDTLMTFKKSCGNVLKFAGNNIPVALIQVVTITVHIVGAASLMARKLTDYPSTAWFLTEYMPFFKTFQFFLYFSWLKFGAMAANPFGEDDYDIDVVKLLQCHIEDALRLQSFYNNELTKELVSLSLNELNGTIKVVAH